MSLTSSPQQDIQAMLRRRNVAVVPKDQQKILDKEGSWAVEASKRQGTPHVPSHVLETITRTFLLGRKRGPDNANNSPAAAIPPSSADADKKAESVEESVEVQAAVTKQDTREQHGNGSNQEDGARRAASPTSSPVSPCTSWAVSSVNDDPRDDPIPCFESQAIQETPMPKPISKDASPKQTRPHMQDRATQEDEDEDEMDMELPHANQQPNGRVNMESARLQVTSTPAPSAPSQSMEAVTPPCGQPNQNVVPDSVIVDKEDELQLEQKRHRRCKPIIFDDTIPVKTNPSTTRTRLPSTAHIKEVESSSSGSVIPATCETAPTQNSTAAPPPSLLAAPDTSKPNDYQARSAPVTHTAQGSYSPGRIVPSAPSDPPSDPYTIFNSTYVDYRFQNGDLKNFVKACICLEYLESERALRDYLYDDFIRAFSDGYLKYVNEARPGQEPLPAIEWFNMLQGAPKYCQMVITRQNLRLVLDMFPMEVAIARQFIREPREEQEKATKRKVDAIDVDAQTPDISPPGPARLKRQRQSPQLGSDATGPPDPVPSSSARSRGPMASQYFERLASISKSGAGKQRSPEEQARLREYLRRRKASGAMSGSGSRHGST